MECSALVWELLPQNTWEGRDMEHNYLQCKQFLVLPTEHTCGRSVPLIIVECNIVIAYLAVPAKLTSDHLMQNLI